MPFLAFIQLHGQRRFVGFDEGFTIFWLNLKRFTELIRSPRPRRQPLFFSVSSQSHMLEDEKFEFSSGREHQHRNDDDEEQAADHPVGGRAVRPVRPACLTSTMDSASNSGTGLQACTATQAALPCAPRRPG